ncbi:Phosphatidylcholine:diacylglycerol cholinephosphotransferase [Thalictrum thalictroides]|uniref:Phosphatidylcholine:diacylglycerol cholinephosphotransferase n=1 Tax=Thalictrum thalictroides TaxID=46969 RepID=A0A7J6WK51_THATH|nr:Phosphatidylcholine:diacylglycerol cholinephosphotransferase [Thalictrum thalictroides]
MHGNRIHSNKLRQRTLVNGEHSTTTLSWSLRGLAKNHPILLFLGLCVLYLVTVEYTILMIPSSSPPFDLGFVLTRPIHDILDAKPTLNTVLAGLNTLFFGLLSTYILRNWLVEGRARATIAALFMFTCRGILGYCTQLPLPEKFLGSGLDFPVGSFFLFFSGHVAISVIASLDLRRRGRGKVALVIDLMNVMQMARLLGTRGHYTIDVAVGVGAGLFCDSLAGKYEESKKKGLSHKG